MNFINRTNRLKTVSEIKFSNKIILLYTYRGRHNKGDIPKLTQSFLLHSSFFTFFPFILLFILLRISPPFCFTLLLSSSFFSFLLLPFPFFFFLILYSPFFFSLLLSSPFFFFFNLYSSYFSYLLYSSPIFSFLLISSPFLSYPQYQI